MNINNTKSKTTPLKSYDVIVIGGGIVGCSLAYFLSKDGKRVLVLDKQFIGSRQSGKAWGFIRKQLRNLQEIPMTSLAIELWKSLAVELEDDILWSNQGGIQLIENEQQLNDAKIWINQAENFNLSTQIIDADTLRIKMPYLSTSVDSAIYTPDDGQVDPYKAVKALQKKAIKYNASFLENIIYDHIDFDDEKFIFHTNKGNYLAEQVVCCAGAGSYFFLKRFNIVIPQLAARVSSIKTAPLPLISNNTFLGGGIGFRQDKDGCITLGCQNESDVDLTWRYLVHGNKFISNKKISRNDFSVNFSHIFKNESKKELIPIANFDHIHLAITRFNKLFPTIPQVEIQNFWAEYIDFLPNFNPIIDRHPVMKNLVIATGFSGSGFALGPAVGKLLSEILAFEQPSIDITNFRFPNQTRV